MGEIDYQKKYVTSFLNEKKMLTLKREKAFQKLEDARKRYKRMEQSVLPRKKVKLQSAGKMISMCENSLSIIDNEIRFLRPRFDEDVAYRNRQYEEFAEKIKKIVPDGVPLRFHGCPIYAAEQIIASGEISSSVDRIGVETSYDGAGQISVTTRDDLYITVQSYTNLNYDYNLPAGCIFVVTPESPADEECGKSLLMGNVSFKEDPGRLVAVISTPENMPSVRSWLADGGMAVEKAVDFDGFVDNIAHFIESVRLSYRDLPCKVKDISFADERSLSLSLDEQIMVAFMSAVGDHSVDKAPAKEFDLER